MGQCATHLLTDQFYHVTLNVTLVLVEDSTLVFDDTLSTYLPCSVTFSSGWSTPLNGCREGHEYLKPLRSDPLNEALVLHSILNSRDARVFDCFHTPAGQGRSQSHAGPHTQVRLVEEEC